MLEPLPRVAVIGAGSSGIAVAKALWDRGIPFDCYEASDRVGGNWVFRNRNGMSSAYRSLHINTSRDRMAYRDYPMPADYPDFPHHSQIAEYFEAYVDHFGFRDTIRFETSVAHVERDANGTYRVELAGGESQQYDAVAVANGHHWDPRMPDPPFPGHDRFTGTELHSHHYIDPREPHDLTGKRVVVVGMGNSAMDIACELSHRGVAERVFLSARRGAWVIPKYMFGKPLDQSITLPRWLPDRMVLSIGKAAYRLAVGKMSDYGLPEPEHDLHQAHPTVSSDLLTRVGSGDILVRPNIAELGESSVRFADGTTETVDAIIYCTGYRVTFPFFDESFISAPDNDLPLFMRVFEPDVPGLFFIGLLQPWGAIMPLAEAQAKWVADYLCGGYALPSRREMRMHVARERKELFDRYVASPRHTMQVDFDRYWDELHAEWKRGQRRARRSSQLPLPARASNVTQP